MLLLLLLSVLHILAPLSVERFVAHGMGQRPASDGQEWQTTPSVEASVSPVVSRVRPVHWHVFAFYAAAAGRRWLRASSAGCGGPAAAFARQHCDLRPATPSPRQIARWLAHRPATLAACTWAWALLLLPLARTATCCPGPDSPAPRASARSLVVCPSPPRRWLAHWLWLCCTCLCRPGFAFSDTTVMVVRLPVPGRATAARAEPGRLGSRASRSLHSLRTIQ